LRVFGGRKGLLKGTAFGGMKGGDREKEWHRRGKGSEGDQGFLIMSPGPKEGGEVEPVVGYWWSKGE